MKAISFTPAQVQNFIHICDGEDCPNLLQEFNFNYGGKVYNSKKNWIINMDKKAINWLIKEQQDFIKFLKQEIINYTTKVDLTADYPYYNKLRIVMANRVIQKLS